MRLTVLALQPKASASSWVAAPARNRATTSLFWLSVSRVAAMGRSLRSSRL
jgi:hypothetical protein